MTRPRAGLIFPFPSASLKARMVSGKRSLNASRSYLGHTGPAWVTQVVSGSFGTLPHLLLSLHYGPSATHQTSWEDCLLSTCLPLLLKQMYTCLTPCHHPNEISITVVIKIQVPHTSSFSSGGAAFETPSRIGPGFSVCPKQAGRKKSFPPWLNCETSLRLQGVVCCPC